MGLWATKSSWMYPCPWKRGWNQIIFKVLQTKPFYVSVAVLVTVPPIHWLFIYFVSFPAANGFFFFWWLFFLPSTVCALTSSLLFSFCSGFSWELKLKLVTLMREYLNYLIKIDAATFQFQDFLNLNFFLSRLMPFFFHLNGVSATFIRFYATM